MNYNPSPKSTFQTNPEKVKAHHVLVENEYLREAISISLLQMWREIYELAPPDMGSCAAANLRMTGAQDFVKILLNLAETPATIGKTDSGNLPSNVSTMPSQKRN